MKAQLLKFGFFVLTMISANNLMAFTAVVDGNWSDAATWGGVAPSGNVSNQDIIIPSGIDVDLDIDVSFSGLLNNFTVDGTLTSSTGKQLSIQLGTFNGSGDIDIERIEFSGLLTTYSHTGDLTVNIFVNSGALLTITSQLSVSDSLNLEDGSLTLNTGGNLSLDSSAMIVRNSGSLATSGGVFNSGGSYHVRYIGGSKTTGIEINSMSLQNVEINLDDNSTVLTMGSNLQIHGNLDLNTGILSVGSNDLEIQGSMEIQSGAALTTAATSNIMIQTAGNLNSGLVFTSGSSIDQLTIEYTGTGSVELESALAVAGELQLHEGTLSIEGGGTLTMNAGSMVHVESGKLESNGGTFEGTAAYNVTYAGDAAYTTGEEITGSGLNDVEINIQQGDVVLNDNVTVNGELELNNGKLDLNGNDLVLNGTFEQEMSAEIIGDTNSDLHLNITMLGNDTIYFDDANNNLEQLVVDLTGGNMVLGSRLHIHDELTMTSGNVVLLNENLVIMQNANITGYSDTRYIVTNGSGKLQMYVTPSSPYLVFPVGTPSGYSPASIQQASGSAAGNFMVKAFIGVYTYGTDGGGYNTATGASLVNRTWLVESDAGTVNMNLKLGWMAASEVNGFDRNNAYIAHYTSGNWDMHASGSAVSGANSTYEIDRTGLTGLSPFTVADENSQLSVDEETALLSINLYPNPCTDGLNISYDSKEQFTYQITDAAGRIYTTTDKGNNQLDVSGLSSGVYLLKMTNKENNQVAVRQFIKK